MEVLNLRCCHIVAVIGVGLYHVVVVAYYAVDYIDSLTVAADYSLTAASVVDVDIAVVGIA